MNSYAHFVKLIAHDPANESRILEICGQRYEAHANDHSIDAAIAMASFWQLQQVTYIRVLHLRKWIDVNKGLQVPETGVEGLLACKEFVDRVIGIGFLMSGWRNRKEYMEQLRENERIFLEEEFIDTA